MDVYYNLKTECLHGGQSCWIILHPIFSETPLVLRETVLKPREANL